MRMRLRPVFLVVFATLVYVASGCLFGEVPSPDLSKPPDPAAMAAIARSGKLPEFEKVLRKTLADAWKPGLQGRGGSCSSPSFAAWVDLWRWLDLVCADEGALAAQWAARHCFLESRGGNHGEGSGEPEGAATPSRVVVIPSGASLEERPGTGSQRVAAMLAADPSLLAAVLGRLVPPPYEVGKGALADRLDPEFLAVTVSDPIFLRSFSEGFSEADFAPKAILNLEAIWKRNRSDWREFLSLALAIALVSDQKPPAFWPHQQVAPGEVPRREIPPEEQFALWGKAAREGRLAKQPSLLTPRELMFVVDPPLDPSEFDWVRNTTSLTPRDPARSFQSIRYDTARTSSKQPQLLEWPNGSYRLERIREFGGICVDQAYYASSLAKAVGIPSLLFSGQGKDGGHAWIGFMKGPQLWDFSVGRYDGRNYSTGMALDPRTWSPISDHELGLLIRPPVGNTAAVDAARRDMAMAALFGSIGDPAGEGRSLQSALASYPENPELWNAKESWLVRSGASPARLAQHHESAMRQFERFPDLRNNHREALIRIYLESGDRNAAEAVALRIIHENREGTAGARADLAARAAWLLVAGRLNAGDPEGAVAEADRLLSLLGGEGGGEALYRVVYPLADALISTGKNSLACSFLTRACRLLHPSKGSLVAQELLKLWEQAGGDPKNPDFLKLN